MYWYCRLYKGVFEGVLLIKLFKMVTALVCLGMAKKTEIGRERMRASAKTLTSSQRLPSLTARRFFKLVRPRAERIARGGSAWMAYHSWRVAEKVRGRREAAIQTRRIFSAFLILILVSGMTRAKTASGLSLSKTLARNSKGESVS